MVAELLNAGRPLRILGLMSGTSLDGVDAAIVETDGESICGFGAARTFEFTAEERAVLSSATSEVLAADGRTTPEQLARAASLVEDAHIRAVRAMLAIEPDVALVGFHGQTMIHRPERRLTLQIGDPQAIATTCGLPVIGDFRRIDLAAGGQGAPIVPIYHAALADKLALRAPVAFLNIGGVANVTWIGEDGELIAFDVGPGNGLIDELVSSHGLGAYDRGGALGLSGRVDAGAFSALASHPFLAGRPPKSLDRYDFDYRAALGLSPQDGAATLAAVTAEGVRRSVDHMPEAPRKWVVCGGGRHNQAIMSALRDGLAEVCAAEDLGLRGDWIEAEAMGYLAARSMRGLPITFPGTTGVPRPSQGGDRFLAGGPA